MDRYVLPSSWRFQTRVLVPVVAVMLLMVGSLLWMLSHHFSHQVEPAVGETARAAGRVFGQAVSIRRRSLSSHYRSAANEPKVKSLAQVVSDVPTVTRFLEDMLEEQQQCVWITLANADGEPIATVAREPDLKKEDVAAAAKKVAQRPLNAQPEVGTVSIGFRLFDVVSATVVAGDSSNATRAGVLVFGEDLGKALIGDLHQLNQSEVIVMVDGHRADSTLPIGNEDAARLAGLLHRSSALPSGSIQPERISLGDGREYFALAKPLPVGPGHSDTGYVLLSSLVPALRQLEETERLLVTVSFFGILLGTLGVWWIVRRVASPLRDLRDGAEAVGRGDFSRRVEVRSSDECGELASAFNQMTENLQTSRQKLEQTVETLKTTQAQLVQSEKLSAIGQFTAGVAHELNNPLTAVLGFTEMMSMSKLTERQKEYVDSVLNAAQRCKRIVQNLLSFARQHQPERKSTDLNELVQTTLKFLYYQLHTSNIEVVSELAPNLPRVMADTHQIQQVFINLITNARQAMEGHRPDSRLTVKTQAAGGRVQVVFKDNGPGIPAEHLLRVFDPFFTTKEVGKGTGLGLSLCYGIAQEHGGSIQALSLPGEGATFIVELPVAKSAAGAELIGEAKSGEVTQSVEGQGKNVLVIDDEATLLKLVRDALSDVGYQVDTASDGEAGLRFLSERTYHITFCDWKMPGLSGQQVYERVLERDRGAARRFVFMSGDLVNDKARQFLEASKLPYLAKPFTVEELRVIARQTVGTG